MQIAKQISYMQDPREAIEEVALLEKAGLDLVWIPESYTYDAVSLMGAIAVSTERVQIGSGILPLFTRTPSLLAMTAVGIDSLSGGRCVLGIGASGPQVIEGFHGVAYDRPVARTRETIDICRKIWERDGHLAHDGPLYPIPVPEGKGTGLGRPLKLIHRPVRSRIPIWVAALGERNLAMTAEKADGWLPLFFLPDKAKEVFGSALDEGTAKRDDKLPPLGICAGGVGFIGEGPEVQEVLDRLARPTAAFYIGAMGAKGKNFYNTLMCRYGYEAEAAEIQNLYLAGHAAEAQAKVPDEFLRLTNLCGPASYVRERVAAYRDAGVTVLTVAPEGPNPAVVLEQIKTWAS